jgi:transposase
MEKSKKTIRTFSTDFKKEKVSMIEQGKITVTQITRIYSVSSSAVYKWIRKYSKLITKGERMVVQKESEQAKTEMLFKRVAELERLIGQKQVELEYLKKVIEFGSELVEMDLKKKYESK